MCRGPGQAVFDGDLYDGPAVVRALDVPVRACLALMQRKTLHLNSGAALPPLPENPQPVMLVSRGENWDKIK